MTGNTLYLLEGEWYNDGQIKYDELRKLRFDGHEAKDILLKTKGYIYEEDRPLLLFDSTASSLKAKFVGILYADNETRVISLPKYINNLFKTGKEEELEKYWKVIEKLLYKYESQIAEKDPLFNSCTNYETSELAFARQFFELFITNGSYKKQHKTYSTKKGRTAWGKTVNSITPDYINDSILYNKTVNMSYVDEIIDITNIQTCILNYLYFECGYRNIFKYNLEIPESCFSAEYLLDEENKEYLIKLLLNEKQLCFKDDDIKVINMMMSFINKDFRSDLGTSKAFGLVEFYNLYEVVLGDYLGNQISIINHLSGKTDVCFKSKFLLDKENNPIEIPDINDLYRQIKKIHWNFRDKSYNFNNTYNSSTRANNYGIDVPDIIVEFLHKDEKTNKEQKYVLVFDAKYYNFYPENGKVKSVPSDYDVIKQIRYVETLKEIYSYLDKELANEIIFKNIFIFPWRRKYNGNYGVFGHPVDAYSGEDVVLGLIVNFDKVIDFVLNDEKTSKQIKEEKDRILNSISNIQTIIEEQNNT